MRVICLLCLVLIVSCNSVTKKTSSDIIYNEEVKAINWDAVDEYPTFLKCKEKSSQALRQKCFQTTLTNHILKSLEVKAIKVSQPIQDTIIVDFEISELGRLGLKKIAVSELVDDQIPEIDAYIIKSLKTLPPILPALKRGQQVKTQFKLPIVIAVD